MNVVESCAYVKNADEIFRSLCIFAVTTMQELCITYNGMVPTRRLLLVVIVSRETENLLSPISEVTKYGQCLRSKLEVTRLPSVSEMRCLSAYSTDVQPESSESSWI